MTTSLLRCAFALKHEVFGQIRGFGDQFNFVEKTGVGVRVSFPEFKIASTDGWVTLWDGRVAGQVRDWSALALQINGSGTFHLRWTRDTPVSESDLTASGSAVQTSPDSMSCLGPMFKDNNRVLMNDGTTLGKYYKLEAKTTETFAVTLDMAIME